MVLNKSDNFMSGGGDAYKTGNASIKAHRNICDVCFMNCDLGRHGDIGRCGFYKNYKGMIVKPSNIMISEETEITAPTLGIYHAYQKERFAAIGSFSCNLKCIHCINFSYSYFLEGANNSKMKAMKVDDISHYFCGLKERGYEGVVFSFSEWTIYGDLFGEITKSAKESNLIVILCTNGMFNEETMQIFVDKVDVIRLDFKGLGSRGFMNLTGIDGYGHVAKMYKKLKYHSKENTRPWIEISYCPVHELNDDDMETRSFARMIADVGETIPPMRLLRFIPSARTGHLRIGTDADQDNCEKILREEGFPFIYKEKDIDEDRLSSECPKCGNLLLMRGIGFIKGSCVCAGCGSDWTNCFHQSVQNALN